MYGNACLHITPLHILSVKKYDFEGQSENSQEAQTFIYVHHVKIMRLKWQSNLILYIMLYFSESYDKENMFFVVFFSFNKF